MTSVAVDIWAGAYHILDIPSIPWEGGLGKPDMIRGILEDIFVRREEAFGRKIGYRETMEGDIDRETGPEGLRRRIESEEKYTKGHFRNFLG